MGFDSRVDGTAVTMTDHEDQLQASLCRGIARGGELIQGVDQAVYALIPKNIARDPDREEVIESLPKKDLRGLPCIRTAQDQREWALLLSVVGIVLAKTDLRLDAGNYDRLPGDRRPASFS